MTSIKSLVVAAAAAVFLMSVEPGLAQSPSSDEVPITIHTRQVSAQSGQLAAALLDKAERQGRVRVIVELDVAMAQEDEITSAQAANQVRALQAAQSTVASRALLPASQVIRFETIPFMSAYVTRGQLQQLLADGQVVSIQEDLPILRPFLSESVPLIRANRLARQGDTGEGQVVAVLDTGADYAHSMLKNKVVAGLCRSTTSSTTSSTCPGGVAASNATNSGKNCSGASGCSHGTHVSTIAVGNNRVLKGVARGSKLISGQVFSLCPTCSQGTTAFFTDIDLALERVYNLRNQFTIASINMSLGTGSVFNTACDSLLPATAAIINKLFNAKIATVIASGNGFSDSGISAPACIAKAIAVGSTTKSDVVSDFSNHHALVDVMAPGSSINAGVPGGGYAVFSGTSMASPHVAGAVALLKGVRPAANVNQVLNSLKQGVPVSRAGVTKQRIDMIKARNFLEDLVPASASQAAVLP
jgi:subtilisin family serine protease